MSAVSQNDDNKAIGPPEVHTESMWSDNDIFTDNAAKIKDADEMMSDDTVIIIWTISDLQQVEECHEIRMWYDKDQTLAFT